MTASFNNHTHDVIDIINLSRYVVPSASDAYGLANSLTYIFRNYFSDITSGYKNFKFVLNWYSSSTSTSTGQCIVEGAILNGRATGITKARSGTDTYAFYADVTEGGADTVVKKLDSFSTRVTVWLFNNDANQYTHFYIHKDYFTSLKIECRDDSTVGCKYSLNDDNGTFKTLSIGSSVTVKSSDLTGESLTIYSQSTDPTHVRVTINV